MDKTANERKRRQREEARKWLERNAFGKSPDALVTALQNNECKLIWVVTPEKKVSKKK
jgi:hypothetical protein